NNVASTQTVTITVTGANDAPVVSADVSGDSGTALHAIAELPNTTNDSTDLDAASGSLAFNDVDLNDTHTFINSGPTFGWLDSGGQGLSLDGTQIGLLTSASSLTLTPHDSTGTGLGSVDFAYSAADSTFDFLAAGEKLTIAFDLALPDVNNVASTQ